MFKKKATTFGETIDQLWLEINLRQRKVTTHQGLDIDTSLVTKYERNVKQTSKEFILKITELFKVYSKTIISEVMRNKIANQVFEKYADSKLLRVLEKVRLIASNLKIKKL